MLGDDTMKNIKKKDIPGICSIAATIFAFVWSTWWVLIPSEHAMLSDSIFMRLFLSAFISIIFSGLWCAFVMLFAMVLYMLLGYKLGDRSKDADEVTQYGIWFMANWALAFLLFGIQFFIFGDGVPLIFMK